MFDDAGILDGHAVVIDGPGISAVVAAEAVPSNARQQHVEGLLSPGFVDGKSSAEAD